VNSTRNIASNAAIFMPDLERKRNVIRGTICFAWCTKASLRGVRPTADELRELTTDEMRMTMIRPYPGPPERRPTLHLTERQAYDEVMAVVPEETFEHLPMMMIDEIKKGIKGEVDDRAQRGGAEAIEGWQIVLGADLKVRGKLSPPQPEGKGELWGRGEQADGRSGVTRLNVRRCWLARLAQKRPKGVGNVMGVVRGLFRST
jgi:hypothetical protein